MAWIVGKKEDAIYYIDIAVARSIGLNYVGRLTIIAQSESLERFRRSISGGWRDGTGSRNRVQGCGVRAIKKVVADCGHR